MNVFSKSSAAKIMVFDSLNLADKDQITTLLIDDFTLEQHVSDNGVDHTATSSLESLSTGTQLKQVTRNVSALAIGGIYEFETVIIGNSFLKINNSGGSNGTTFLEYCFESTDFSSLSHGVLLHAVDVDFDISVNISINGGLASSGFRSYSGTRFFQPYSTFLGDKNQLKHVTRLRLDFKLAQHNATKSHITRLDHYKKIPNPAILNLMGLSSVELGSFD